MYVFRKKINKLLFSLELKHYFTMNGYLSTMYLFGEQLNYSMTWEIFTKQILFNYYFSDIFTTYLPPNGVKYFSILKDVQESYSRFQLIIN